MSPNGVVLKSKVSNNSFVPVLSLTSFTSATIISIRSSTGRSSSTSSIDPPELDLVHPLVLPSSVVSTGKGKIACSGVGLVLEGHSNERSSSVGELEAEEGAMAGVEGEGGRGKS